MLHGALSLIEFGRLTIIRHDGSTLHLGKVAQDEPQLDAVVRLKGFLSQCLYQQVS